MNVYELTTIIHDPEGDDSTTLELTTEPNYDETVAEILASAPKEGFFVVVVQADGAPKLTVATADLFPAVLKDVFTKATAAMEGQGDFVFDAFHRPTVKEADALAAKIEITLASF